MTAAKNFIRQSNNDLERKSTRDIATVIVALDETTRQLKAGLSDAKGELNTAAEQLKEKGTANEQLRLELEEERAENALLHEMIDLYRARQQSAEELKIPTDDGEQLSIKDLLFLEMLTAYNKEMEEEFAEKDKAKDLRDGARSLGTSYYSPFSLRSSGSAL